MKICPKCKQEKDGNEFYKSRTNKSGLGSWCKECNRNNNKEPRRKDSKKKWAEVNAEKTKEAYLKHKYNYSLDEYKKLLQDQDYRCASCGVEMQPPHIDHDHKTGKVRGLLCGNCNRVLGIMQEDKDKCYLLIGYMLGFEK